MSKIDIEDFADKVIEIESSAMKKKLDMDPFGNPKKVSNEKIDVAVVDDILCLLEDETNED